MSPPLDSTAKSSSMVPISVPAGSSMTRYCVESGIAPPDGDRGHARAPGGAQHAADTVAVEQRAATVGVQLDDRVEVLARELAVGPGAPQAREQLVLVPGLGHARGDDRLRQDVERCARLGRAIEQALPHRDEQRGRFDQLVLGQREEPALGRAADAVSGATDALQQRRDRARRAELHDQVDVADVDAELERGGGDQRLELAALQPLLGVQSALLRETRVVGRDRVLAEDLRELGADALGHLARSDEDERRAVLADQIRDAGVDLGPGLVRADRRERRGRDLDLEVDPAPVSLVDDLALAVLADEEVGDGLDRLLRRREADALDVVLRRARSRRSRESARCEPRLLPSTA